MNKTNFSFDLNFKFQISNERFFVLVYFGKEEEIGQWPQGINTRKNDLQ